MDVTKITCGALKDNLAEAAVKIEYEKSGFLSCLSVLQTNALTLSPARWNR